MLNVKNMLLLIVAIPKYTVKHLVVFQFPANSFPQREELFEVTAISYIISRTPDITVPVFGKSLLSVEL